MVFQRRAILRGRLWSGVSQPALARQLTNMRDLLRLPLGLIRILLSSTVILASLAALATGIAALLAWRGSSGLFDANNILVGLTCSLVVALFVVIFHVRREEQRWTSSNPLRDA